MENNIKRNKKVYCVDGVNEANCIRMLNHIFGKQNVVSVEINSRNCLIDIVLNDCVDLKEAQNLMVDYPSFNIQVATIKSLKK